MEVHVTSHSFYHLISSLNLSPKGNSANYILSRSDVKFLPESGNTWSSSNRTIRFRISDSSFLDLASIRLGMTVYNTTVTTGTTTGVPLTPILPAIGMIQRARIYLSAALVEDVDNVSTFTAIFERLKNSGRRANDALESGHSMVGAVADTNAAVTAENYDVDNESLVPIAAGQARRTISKLPFGLMAHDMWCPLSQVSAGGLVVELELASDLWQAFKYNALHTPGWAVRDVFLFGTCYEVDSSISNSLSAHVLSGTPLPYHSTTTYSTRHYLTQDNFSIQLQRSSTRLKQIFCVIHTIQ